MRAGRSRSKRRKASTLSRISELVDPLQGGDGMRRVPFFPMLITVRFRWVATWVANHLNKLCNRSSNSWATAKQSIGRRARRQQRWSWTGRTGVPVSTGRTAPLTNTPVMAMPPRTQVNLIIGSFNMQRLALSKLSDPNLMRVYADLIRRFDVLALQEVTSEDQNTIPTLLRYVNEGGAQYSYTISPRIGRKYFEQYVFVYDTRRVVTQQSACFVMRDENDLLHREPFVGRFATLAPNPFTFCADQHAHRP